MQLVLWLARDCDQSLFECSASASDVPKGAGRKRHSEKLTRDAKHNVRLPPVSMHPKWTSNGWLSRLGVVRKATIAIFFSNMTSLIGFKVKMLLYLLSFPCR